MATVLAPAELKPWIIFLGGLGFWHATLFVLWRERRIWCGRHLHKLQELRHYRRD